MVGSVAGVIAVLVAVIFGILQFRHGGKDADLRLNVDQSVQAGRDAYTAGGDQYIAQDRRSDQ